METPILEPRQGEHTRNMKDSLGLSGPVGAILGSVGLIRVRAPLGRLVENVLQKEA